MRLKKTQHASVRSLTEVVSELEKPSFIATGSDIVKDKLTLLKVYIDPLDPETVTNWSSISNCMVIWIESEVGKRNARYFYDEMRNDKAFDGSTWYSSRSPFGEHVTICEVDFKGNVTTRKTQRVGAIGMYIDGFINKGPMRKEEDQGERTFHIFGSEVGFASMKRLCHIQMLVCVCVLSLAGCRKPTMKEVIGSYQKKQPHGNETLELRADSRFTQVFTPTNAAISTQANGSTRKKARRLF